MFRIHVPVSPQLQREYSACYVQHHVVQSRCTRTNVGVTCRGASGPQQPTDLPWKLMGRAVTEETIRISREQKYMLILSAAATASGLSNEEFESRLQDVITLLPDIRERLLSLKPQFLAELCTDPEAVAMKLLKLRELFPLANISMMVTRRPLLLLDEHFSQVAEAHDKLHAMFPEGGVDQMVEQQPLLLAADVDHTVGELERLLGQGASRLLLTQPQLILSVMNNAPLSLWLMPGVDIRIMLLRNPAMLLAVQRGSGALGPPAEVMMGPYSI